MRLTRMVLTGLVLALVACADKHVSSLRADGTTLTDRLESREQTAAPSWSCAAYCLTYYRCESEGTSTVKWRTTTATGATAAEAFVGMSDLCDDALVVDAQCAEGKIVRTRATLPNACVRN